MVPEFHMNLKEVPWLPDARECHACSECTQHCHVCYVLLMQAQRCHACDVLPMQAHEMAADIMGRKRARSMAGGVWDPISEAMVVEPAMACPHIDPKMSLPPAGVSCLLCVYILWLSMSFSSI